GGVLIALFFFFDLIRGEPLDTPTFLSGALLGQDTAQATAARIGLFTVLHFVAFIALGVLASVVIDATGIPRNLMVGAAYGLFGCSLLFYSALVVSGTRILDAPAWPVVFFGNVVAGVVIVGYLRWARRDPSDKRSGNATGGVIREGIAAGLIGAGVVALWFLVLDSVVGRPLYTPAALGSAFLYGASASDAVLVSPGTVLGYTVFHIAAFIVFGIVVSALVTQVEKFPPLVFGLIILFVVFETFVIFMVAILGTWLMDELAWWAILVGNLLAAVSMGTYLWRVHPLLREKLRDDVLWAEP
ncbi:MAG: hypothetical protein KAI98_08775, partial [Gemmatimonadetes bacterium]|nr:hypothetical protein [Gemmatimonadota bacterium]